MFRNHTALSPKEIASIREMDRLGQEYLGETSQEQARERLASGEPLLPGDGKLLKGIGGTVVPDPGYFVPPLADRPPLTPEEDAAYARATMEAVRQVFGSGPAAEE